MGRVIVTYHSQAVYVIKKPNQVSLTDEMTLPMQFINAVCHLLIRKPLYGERT